MDAPQPPQPDANPPVDTSAQATGFAAGFNDIEDMMFLAAEGGTRSALEQQQKEIERLRAILAEGPDVFDSIYRLTHALAASGRPENEDEALQILDAAYQRLGHEQLRVMKGDVQIVRYERIRRSLRRRAGRANDPASMQALRVELQQLSAEQLKFELNEYRLRAEKFPDDLNVRVALAKRFEAAGMPAQAVPHYEAASKSPQHRGRALGHLGQIFVNAGRFHDAIMRLREGLEGREDQAGSLALAMRYELVRALNGMAERDRNLALADEALTLARKIAQENTGFKQITDRIAELEALHSSLLTDFSKDPPNG